MQAMFSCPRRYAVTGACACTCTSTSVHHHLLQYLSLWSKGCQGNSCIQQTEQHLPMCTCICKSIWHTHLQQFLSEAFQARTRETHRNHCSDLKGPLHDHYATTYGLHRDSSLNSLQFFHVTEGLIPDIMNDCFRGLCSIRSQRVVQVLLFRRNLECIFHQQLDSIIPILGIWC